MQGSAKQVKCGECDLPAATIENGALVIRSRHHSEKHVTVFGLEYLRRILEESEPKGDKIADR